MVGSEIKKIEQSTKVPPKWWTKVIGDLERASSAAQKSYRKPGIILGKETQPNDSSIILGYYIRLGSGEVGYYSVKNIKKIFPIGARLKGELPDPTRIEEEPSIESYIYSVISEKISLIPARWLHKIIDKIITGKPITVKEDMRPFHSWILIPVDKRNNDLYDLLYKAVEYEGIKGLYRFNDILE